MGIGVNITFWVASIIAVIAAVSVIAIRDLFHAALLLVLSFLAVAAVYVTLSADFLAMVQILVYVGAIGVLLIFAIMVTRDVRRGNPFNDFKLNDIGHLWDYKQTVRYGVGAVMISNFYSKNITLENMIKTVKAKIAFKCQLGILDDIIDRGEYEYKEARDLFSIVVKNMFSLDFNPYFFERDLYSILNEDQFKLARVMTSYCATFNELYIKSNNRDRYMPYMEDLNKRVLAGQPLTIYQKKDYFDIKKMEKVSREFYTPDNDLLWQDKLSAYISGGTKRHFYDRFQALPWWNR